MCKYHRFNTGLFLVSCLPVDVQSGLLRAGKAVVPKRGASDSHTILTKMRTGTVSRHFTSLYDNIKSFLPLLQPFCSDNGTLTWQDSRGKGVICYKPSKYIIYIKSGKLSIPHALKGRLRKSVAFNCSDCIFTNEPSFG